VRIVAIFYGDDDLGRSHSIFRADKTHLHHYIINTAIATAASAAVAADGL